MNIIVLNGEQMTTISAICNHYADGHVVAAKKIRPYVANAIKKIKTIKVTSDQIKENRDLFDNLILVGTVPVTGLILINLDDVEKIEYYFKFILKQIKEGVYKTNRFKSGRTKFDELKLELEMNNKNITNDEFKSVLSYISRLEIGQWKEKALRSASQNFKVTQVRINEIFNSLEIQVDYVNKPKNYI